MSFNNPNSTDFAYTPKIDNDVSDADSKLNKREKIWKGQKISINGNDYVLNKVTMQVYDYESYLNAVNNGTQPTLIGKLKKNNSGNYVID